MPSLAKFGLPLPAKEAYEIHRNDPDKRGLWAKAIAKEMKAVEVLPLIFAQWTNPRRGLPSCCVAKWCDCVCAVLN